jgi:hypothetical protein
VERVQLLAEVVEVVKHPDDMLDMFAVAGTRNVNN